MSYSASLQHEKGSTSTKTTRMALNSPQFIQNHMKKRDKNSNNKQSPPRQTLLFPFLKHSFKISNPPIHFPTTNHSNQNPEPTSRQKKKHISLKRGNENLIEGNDVGAKLGALAFIALDGGGHVGHDRPTGDNEVPGPGPGLIQLDQCGLTVIEAEIGAEIVTRPDCLDGLLGCRLGVELIRSERHENQSDRRRLREFESVEGFRKLRD